LWLILNQWKFTNKSLSIMKYSPVSSARKYNKGRFIFNYSVHFLKKYYLLTILCSFLLGFMYYDRMKNVSISAESIISNIQRRSDIFIFHRKTMYIRHYHYFRSHWLIEKTVLIIWMIATFLMISGSILEIKNNGIKFILHFLIHV
jgi:hypothetical protein